MREFSIPALAEVPATATLTDVVFGTAADVPDQIILRKQGADGRWSDVAAREFAEDVSSTAKGLAAAGIQPGDRVGLMSRTCYAWTVIDYAIWTVGAVTVPVYETSSPEQVQWILSDGGAVAVFAETEAHASTIGDARSALPELKHVWMVEARAELTNSGSGVTDEDLAQRMSSRSADDLATIIYTSGTTGRPKGCELTHRNLLSGARNAVQGALTDIFDISGSSTLLFLPLAHSFARIIQVGCLESGATLMHWPDSSTVAKGLPETSPSFLLAVPRVFEKVYNSAQQQASASGAKSKIFAAALWRSPIRANTGCRPAYSRPMSDARSRSAIASIRGSCTSTTRPSPTSPTSRSAAPALRATAHASAAPPIGRNSRSGSG